ncbi:hypothetical protein L6252_01865 [Candidatus Parcubacteria bacterium]|nr:hypothetical protein [Candidatus Parcubacteria bacterium]
MSEKLIKTKNKINTGNVGIGHNPIFSVFQGNDIVFSHEDAVDHGEGNFFEMTGQEMFDLLSSHHREEFRKFLEKFTPDILERHRKKIGCSRVITSEHINLR